MGSNAAPETLTQKFAHFPEEEDRTVLVLAGQLDPSPGTAVRAAVLLVTPTQFTQLAWSELTYRLGWLETSFVADEPEFSLRGALAFASRFGAFCIDGAPVALDFIPASGRSARALTQEELLDVAAEMSIGPGADAERLVRAIFDDAAEAFRVSAPVRAAGLPFRSDRFALFPAHGSAENPRT